MSFIKDCPLSRTVFIKDCSYQGMSSVLYQGPYLARNVLCPLFFISKIVLCPLPRTVFYQGLSCVLYRGLPCVLYQGLSPVLYQGLSFIKNCPMSFIKDCPVSFIKDCPLSLIKNCPSVGFRSYVGVHVPTGQTSSCGSGDLDEG